MIIMRRIIRIQSPPARIGIPSKSTLLGEEGEEGKSARENNIDIDIDKKNSKYINRLSDRNSEIFLNTDQIPYEKATVLTKLQKWGDYTSCGESVGKTKFVPMKTPLSLEFLESTEKYAHILTVEKMLYTQRETKQREVTMIIDLSNHECLYEEDIPEEVHRVHVRNIKVDTEHRVLHESDERSDKTLETPRGVYCYSLCLWFQSNRVCRVLLSR